MEIYEAKERIKFARRALYILVPLSLHCPFRLTDMSDIMEESSVREALISIVDKRTLKHVF